MVEYFYVIYLKTVALNLAHLYKHYINWQFMLDSALIVSAKTRVPSLFPNTFVLKSRSVIKLDFLSSIFKIHIFIEHWIIYWRKEDRHRVIRSELSFAKQNSFDFRLSKPFYNTSSQRGVATPVNSKMKPQIHLFCTLVYQGVSPFHKYF